MTDANIILSEFQNELTAMKRCNLISEVNQKEISSGIIYGSTYDLIEKLKTHSKRKSDGMKLCALSEEEERLFVRQLKLAATTDGA